MERPFMLGMIILHHDCRLDITNRLIENDMMFVIAKKGGYINYKTIF